MGAICEQWDWLATFCRILRHRGSALRPHLSSTMPQISDSGTDECRLSPTFEDFVSTPCTDEPDPFQTFEDILSKIHNTADPVELENLHRQATVELAFRSSEPNKCDNPKFYGLTDTELVALMHEILVAIRYVNKSPDMISGF